MLDAKALALYGFERQDRLELFKPQIKLMIELSEFVSRRNDLKQILVAEKNRLKAPGNNFIKSSCKNLIETVSEEIKSITNMINEKIATDKVLQAKKEVIKEIPGIGDVVANELLTVLPELGNLNRRQIASLAGLAPRSNDSGTFSGYRFTGHARDTVKPILFLAAMATRNSKSELKEFYEKLINKGKKKMVALVALMRKIIVIANAKLHDFTTAQEAIKI